MTKSVTSTALLPVADSAMPGSKMGENPRPKPVAGRSVILGTLMGIFIGLFSADQLPGGPRYLSLLSVDSFSSSQPVRETNNDWRTHVDAPSYLTSMVPPANARDHAASRSEYCKAQLQHPALRLVNSLRRPVRLLDVGANHGHVAIPLLVCPLHMPRNHTILSAEPVLYNVFMMRSVARRVGAPLFGRRWRLVQMGFADVEGPITIFTPTGKRGSAPVNGANAALSSSAATQNAGGVAMNESVYVVRGDDVLRESGFEPNVIKIDVQGAEYRVLLGLQEYLAQPREMFVLAEQSAGLLARSGFEADSVFRLMERLGFSAWCNPRLRMELDGEERVTGSKLTHDDMFNANKSCIDITYIKLR